jgi:acetoin utilization deacetylase AcuC-like enzyme
MKKVCLVYDDVFLSHRTPEYHPETSDRLRACTGEIMSSGLWEKIGHARPERAAEEDVAAVHTREYMKTVSSLGSGYLDPDTYVSEQTHEAALYAAGAVKTAVTMVNEGRAERVFCAVRPPGHHAERDRGMGFCIFNNVAVGARYARKIGYRRVMIADFDVHHGNGTQEIFYEDDSVFYFSTHQFPHYPGTGRASEKGAGAGEGFTMNIPLPTGAGDAELAVAYEDSFRDAAARFEPDIVLVSAGYDLHRDDPLAGLEVTDSGVEKVVSSIVEAAGDSPLVFALEGGYNLEVLARSVRRTIEVMMGQ